MHFLTTIGLFLAVAACVESLALPDHRRLSTSSDDDPASFVDVSAFDIESGGSVSLGSHGDAFKHDDVELGSPIELDDIFHREDAFSSPEVEEDFNFSEVHPELFHSGEHTDFSLSRTRHDNDAKVFPAIYYPESDLSTGNNIAPDYHVKEYPQNYRQVKEFPDVKLPFDDNVKLGHQTNDHQEKDLAGPTSFASGFAFHDQQPTSHHLLGTNFPESQKVTSGFSEAERAITGDQEFPKPGKAVVATKIPTRNGKSGPRNAAGVQRQFGSSDFLDFDYSSSSGSSDPFEGNYDGDYYAPGDNDSTVHVGNDAAYDYDYSNSHGPDLSSGLSSFTDDFARSTAGFGRIRSPQKKK